MEFYFHNSQVHFTLLAHKSIKFASVATSQLLGITKGIAVYRRCKHLYCYILSGNNLCEWNMNIAKCGVCHTLP